MTDINLDQLADELSDFDIPKKSPKSSVYEELIIASFEDIQRFVYEYGRMPENSLDRDIYERIYAVRLDRLRQVEDCKNILLPLDTQGLLTHDGAKNIDNINDFDTDKLASELAELEEDKSSLRDLRHVRSSFEKKAAEEFAVREKCCDFKKFKPLFDQLQSDLDLGNRETIAYKKRPDINSGAFFIVGGQKAYVASIGERFIQEYGVSDSRLRIIFDNGTESGMLMRSFQRALINDESGRQISDPNLGPLFKTNVDKSDKESGIIYVLRSKSNLPHIAENRELIHKIGVTTSTIKKRIANAKDDPTFLMADVRVVASYKLFNINPIKLEHLIQKIFGSVRLDIQIQDRFGKPYSPQEWFMVPLQSIETAVERIKDGTITRYRFDPLTARLIERSDSSK